VIVSTTNRMASRTFTNRGVAGGLAVRGVEVCGPPGARVTAPEVLREAARTNSLLLAPGAVDLLSVRRSLAEVFADLGEFAGMGGAFITGGVRMPPQEKTFAVTLSAGVAITSRWLAGKLTPAASQPAARLRSLELPYELTVPAGGCWHGTALAWGNK
jgi:hypothetical protein